MTRYEKSMSKSLSEVRQNSKGENLNCGCGKTPCETYGEGSFDEKYDLYHKTFSGAMQHAYDYAKKKLGITVDPKEIDNKVATGPRKPSEGKTNKYRLKGKGGNLQIQVYNKGGSKPFELNMYKEQLEIKEGTWAMADERGDAEKLKKLMSKKFKLGKDGEDATNQLYRLLGDDELFDSLYVAGSKNPNGDARPVIINWFKDRIKSNAYNTGADAKALAKKIGLKKLGESVEVVEKFTKKDFLDNEDKNHHTENGVKIVNMFGTSAEKVKMGGIAARHKMKGSISRKDQQDRDALVKKYYPKLKEEIELVEKDIKILVKDVKDRNFLKTY